MLDLKVDPCINRLPKTGPRSLSCHSRANSTENGGECCKGRSLSERTATSTQTSLFGHEGVRCSRTRNSFWTSFWTSSVDPSTSRLIRDVSSMDCPHMSPFTLGSTPSMCGWHVEMVRGMLDRVAMDVYISTLKAICSMAVQHASHLALIRRLRSITHCVKSTQSVSSR